MEYEGSVKASSWLKRIGKRSLLVIEEADGTPFIGSVRDRASRINMEEYWKERDEWRTKDGLTPKWEGTNIAMAFSLLKRNGSLEDHATMLRLAAGKRWEYSRHNKILCKACQGDFRGLRHPLLQCNCLPMLKARKLWVDNCRAYISTSKPEHLRHTMFNILHEAMHSEGGEFACLGTFIPKWVDRLQEKTIRPQRDLRLIKKFLRVVAAGAHLVMREFARLKEISEGDARELRQLSIVQFTEPQQLAVPKARKQSNKADPSNSPRDTIWGSTDGSPDCRLEWTGRIQSALILDATIDLPGSVKGQGQSLIPGARPPVAATINNQSRRRSDKTAYFPWTGLNWYNMPIAPTLGGKPPLPPTRLYTRPIRRTIFRP